MALEPVLTPHGLLTLRETGEHWLWSPSRACGWRRRFTRLRARIVVARRQRGRDCSAASADVLARAWGALCGCPVRPSGHRRGRPSRLCRSPARRVRHNCGGRPTNDRGGIPDGKVLANLWRDMDAAFDAERAEVRLSLQEYLKSRHPAWNLVGRVHFNLAENWKDEDAPFAFLATYTTRLSAAAKAQHLPLGKALQEYSGARNRERLLSLLMPVQRAAEHCSWLKAMVDTARFFTRCAGARNRRCNS